LQREADANRVLLKTFLTRFKETSAQEDIGIQDADARIISKLSATNVTASAHANAAFSRLLKQVASCQTTRFWRRSPGSPFFRNISTCILTQ
jgi:hypothetical protein